MCVWAEVNSNKHAEVGAGLDLNNLHFSLTLQQLFHVSFLLRVKLMSGLINAHFIFRKPCWMHPVLCDINDLGFYFVCVGGWYGLILCVCLVWVDVGKIKLNNIGILLKKANIKYS